MTARKSIQITFQSILTLTFTILNQPKHFHEFPFYQTDTQIKCKLEFYFISLSSDFHHSERRIRVFLRIFRKFILNSQETHQQWHVAEVRGRLVDSFLEFNMWTFSHPFAIFIQRWMRLLVYTEARIYCIRGNVRRDRRMWINFDLNWARKWRKCGNGAAVRRIKKNWFQDRFVGRVEYRTCSSKIASKMTPKTIFRTHRMSITCDQPCLINMMIMHAAISINLFFAQTQTHSDIRRRSWKLSKI